MEVLTPAQKADLAVALKETYFASCDPAYLKTEAFAGDLGDHVDGRYRHFADCVMPWLGRHMPGLAGHAVVEVGSGTGSSTAAIAPHVQAVACFEIDEVSIAAATRRAAILGYANTVQKRALFDPGEAARLGPVDGVFLAAVLEHCTFQECTSLLKTAWGALKPGGWICVVDTPNRLSPIDHHTSLLPFFSTLPGEVRLAYAGRSPRAEFARQFADCGSDAALHLVRWGNGISYHEFELALGEGVHQWIIADGWEREINAHLGILPEDLSVEFNLKLFAGHVSRAFARRAFYFIVQKPAG